MLVPQTEFHRKLRREALHPLSGAIPLRITGEPNE